MNTSIKILIPILVFIINYYTSRILKNINHIVEKLTIRIHCLKKNKIFLSCNLPYISYYYV